MDAGKFFFSRKSHSTREDEILILLTSLSNAHKAGMYNQIKSLIFKITKGEGNTLEKVLFRVAKKDLSTVEEIQKFLADFIEENTNHPENVLIKMLMKKLHNSVKSEKSRRNSLAIHKIATAIPSLMSVNYSTGECSIPETKMSKISKKALESRICKILVLEKSSFSNHFIQDIGKYDFTIQYKDSRAESISTSNQDPVKMLNEFCKDEILAQKISSIYNHKSILYTLNTFNESLIINSAGHPLLMLCNSNSNVRHVGLILKELDGDFAMEIDVILPLQAIQDPDSDQQIPFESSLSSLNIQAEFIIKMKENPPVFIPHSPTLSMNGMIELGAM